MNDVHHIMLNRTAPIGSFAPINVILGISITLLVSIAISLFEPVDAAPDEFEWKVPAPVFENDNDQNIRGVYEDVQTGIVYTVIQNYDAHTGYLDQKHPITISRFNMSTHEFDNTFTRDYPGNNNDYIVHGGRWYVFHTSDGFLRMRINNSTIDTMKWVYDYSGYQLMGIHHGELFFIVFTSEDGQNVELFSVNITTFSWSREVIFQFNDQGPSWEISIRHIFKNGIIYLARSRIVDLPDDKEIMLYEYDTSKGHSEPPRLMWSSDDGPYGGWDFDLDSEKYFHLILGRSVWRLVKLTPSMAVEEWTDLEVAENDTRESRASLFIMVDGSDTLQIVGSLFYNTTENMLVMSWTLSMNYSSGLLRKTIFEGRTLAGSVYESGLITFSDDQVIVGFRSLVDDKYLITYSCRLPPSPDLSIAPQYFRLSEVQGSGEPVMVLIRIKNLGGAAANGYNIDIERKGTNDSKFLLVRRTTYDEVLVPQMGRTHTISLVLPHGGMFLRVTVDDVTPYENIMDNNAFEVFVYINMNNPPITSIVGPENGTVADESIILEGYSFDYDMDDGLITIIQGLPVEIDLIRGSGDWNLTITLEDIPSGDFVMSVQSFDGDDYSRPIFRSIRVDHPEETLVLASYHPREDLSIFVDDRIEFAVGVDDYFSRHLDYHWYVGDERAENPSPYFLFNSDIPGLFIVRVEVTNNRTMVLHEWSISVRVPQDPTILSKKPDDDSIHVQLFQQSTFSVNLSNPDGVSTTITWMVGNEYIPVNNSTNCSLTFDSYGLWTIVVLVHSANTTRTTTWTVSVENSPPRILSIDPPNVITVKSGDLMSFSVDAHDLDGDDITFRWSAVNYSIEDINSSTLDVRFKATHKMEIELYVMVTDGNLSNTTMWHVVVEGKATPSEKGSYLPYLVLIGFIIALLSLGYLISKKQIDQ